MLKRSVYIVVFLCDVMLFAGAAFAACSPGIPCTDYDVGASDTEDLYDNPNAGTDADYNGPKTGQSAGFYDEGACDGNFMNQIYSKAFMEGSRQVIMSEQIIHKPDSVLEYTCFGGYVNEAGTNAGRIFSETTYYTDYEVHIYTADSDDTYTFNINRGSFAACGTNNEPCSKDLATSLSYLIDDALNDYISNNFSHTYLGEATSIDNSGSAVGCSDMLTVWNIAKCLDFGEDDRFRTFQALVNNDPRTIPEECSFAKSFSDDIEAGIDSTKLDLSGPDSASGNISDLCPTAGTVVAGVNTAFYNNLIRLANNCPSTSGTAQTHPHAYSSVDVIELMDYLFLGAENYISGTGGNTGSPVSCSDPIPTGLPVITYEHDAAGRSILTYSGGSPPIYVGERDKYVHYEYICPNPGCYYRPPKQSLAETDAIPNFDDFVTANGVGACIQY